MFAVMGITGQVGGAVATELLQKGKKVRGIVRDPKKAASWQQRGAELVAADCDDTATMQKAFAGAEGVFVMIPPNFAPTPGFVETRTTLAALRPALLAARPAKAAFLSSVGGQQPRSTGLITSTHLLEQEMNTLGIPSAFLRAGWFMENSLWDVAAAREQSKLFSYLQPLDHTFPLVGTKDIGRAAAEVLLQDWKGNRFIEVAGPRRYSPLDMAAAFAHSLHKKVEAVVVPRDKWVSNFVAEGMPEDRTAARVEMVDGFNSGWIDFGVPGTEHFTGTTELQTVIDQLIARV
jgi:NAD(P)H dehydrogenase (quinone)